jgi:hypothetical protein
MDITKFKSKIVNLSSNQRLNGEASNFRLSIPPNAREFSNVVGIQMVSATIPNTFYNITEKNNFFQYKYGVLNTVGNVLVREGQWDSVDLLTEIAAQMTGQINGNVTWELDSTDYKVTVSSDGDSLLFETVDPTLVPLLIKLGFVKRTLVYGPGTSITAPSVINLTG